MRAATRTAFYVCLLLCLVPVSAQSGIATLIDLVNQARIAQGVPPLTASTTLTSVAQAHSNDMAKTQTLSHTGSDKSEFWERMQNGGYALTTGAENILVRADTDGKAAFEQWKTSESHLANMLNPDYHEIGIAYTQAFNGSYYYTMLLGARTDSKPQPVVSATPTATLSLTPTLTSSAPLNVTSAPTRSIATARPTATPLPPSATPTSAIQITHITQATQTTEAAPTVTLRAIHTVAAISTPISTLQVDPTVTISDAQPQILLTYTEDSIALLNITSEPMDISELVFSGENGTFEAIRWRQVGAQALNELLPGDCLQIWTTETRTIPEQPETCGFRQAWIAVGPTGHFWRDAESFTVEKADQIIAQCEIAAGSCRFAITDSADLVAESTADAPADIQLIVEQYGVTLINVSGQPLDLSRLTFVGDSTSLDAQRWEIPQLSRRLDQFPAGDCLQVWAAGESSDPMVPTECGVRHGWIFAPQSEQFWSDGESFLVLNNNISIGTCSTANRVCGLSLP